MALRTVDLLRAETTGDDDVDDVASTRKMKAMESDAGITVLVALTGPSSQTDGVPKARSVEKSPTDTSCMETPSTDTPADGSTID